MGLSKFAQTFAVLFLKSFPIHLICINGWESYPLKSENRLTSVTIVSRPSSVTLAAVLAVAQVQTGAKLTGSAVARIRYNFYRWTNVKSDVR